MKYEDEKIQKLKALVVTNPMEEAIFNRLIFYTIRLNNNEGLVKDKENLQEILKTYFPKIKENYDNELNLITETSRNMFESEDNGISDWIKNNVFDFFESDKINFNEIVKSNRFVFAAAINSSEPGLCFHGFFHSFVFWQDNVIIFIDKILKSLPKLFNDKETPKNETINDWDLDPGFINFDYDRKMKSRDKESENIWYFEYKFDNQKETNKDKFYFAKLKNVNKLRKFRFK